MIFLIILASFGQSIRRQSVSAYGTVMLSDGNFNISQTVGQAFYTFNQNNVLQGFQQPISITIEELITPPLLGLNMNVYPNPANYSFTITCDKEIPKINLYVTNENGKLILSEEIDNLIKYSINCESWINGVYYIILKDNNMIFKTLKLIISK
jgi:hypothetical protein